MALSVDVIKCLVPFTEMLLDKTNLLGWDMHSESL